MARQSTASSQRRSTSARRRFRLPRQSRWPGGRRLSGRVRRLSGRGRRFSGLGRRSSSSGQCRPSATRELRLMRGESRMLPRLIDVVTVGCRGPRRRSCRLSGRGRGVGGRAARMSGAPRGVDGECRRLRSGGDAFVACYRRVARTRCVIAVRASDVSRRWRSSPPCAGLPVKRSVSLRCRSRRWRSRTRRRARHASAVSREAPRKTERPPTLAAVRDRIPTDEPTASLRASIWPWSPPRRREALPARCRRRPSAGRS